MKLHDDLLEQAKHLATREPRRPKQASLRRSVSSAYYALFHLLVNEGAGLVSPAYLRAAVARSFNHGTMRSVCMQFARGRLSSSSSPAFTFVSAPVEAQIKSVADTFVRMQQLRHAADYDSAAAFDRFKVLQTVKLAEAAFSNWRTVRDGPNATAFLAMLLFDKHWRR